MLGGWCEEVDIAKVLMGRTQLQGHVDTFIAPSMQTTPPPKTKETPL
jgi:hypothetical protein